jgi:CRP/FNR family transcriptional regulator, cyclic AMP receptor protein
MSESAREILVGHAFLAGLPAESLELVAERAELCTFKPGALLFREGGAADLVYLITKGHVAIEVHAPNREAIVVETLGAGNVVGLSWAAPPFRYQFDARAIDAVEAVSVDATQLRASLAENPALGYHVLHRLTAVILERLQATRLRLLDLYGKSDGR